MAGQPSDGSWQPQAPNAQQGYGGPEQVRMAWQPPQAQGHPGESYQAADQYQPAEQYQAGERYQAAGQAYQAGEQYPGEQYQPYEPPPPYEQAAHAAYPPPRQPFTLPGQSVPPGNARAAYAARAAGRAAASKGKGFVSSLFDFGFNSYVTPKVIKGLYLLATAWTLLMSILLLLIGVHLGGSGAGTVLFLLLAIAVFILLSLGSIRVFLELFMALHRINENIQVLRDRDQQG